MASKKPCSQCGQPVSPRAPACPHCRTPHPVPSVSSAVGGKLLRLLGWIFGGLFLLTGLVNAFADQLAPGLFMAALGLTVFPPARDAFEKATGRRPNAWVTALAALLLMFAFTWTSIP